MALTAPTTADADGILQQVVGVAPRTPRSVAAGLLRVTRPRQWIKNLLVFGAPGAAGVLTHPHELVLATGAFATFCLAASGTYAFNDVIDAPADRLHPTKRYRPVASGVVPAKAALGFGSLLMALAIAVALAIFGTKFATVVGVYLAITCAYTVRLKNEPIVDLACVSSGFVLRAIGGGVATGVPLSNWFLIVASFGSLLVVAGKRSSELATLGDDGVSHRKALAAYPPALLRTIRGIAAGVAAMAYCLWAFARVENLGPGHHPVWIQLSVVPFVLALLLVELRFESGQGGAPEDLALRDRTLQFVALAWVVLFAVAVYS